MTKRSRQKKKKYLLIISVLIIVSLTCNLPSNVQDNNDPVTTPLSRETEKESQQVRDAESDLRCGKFGYPCSFTETSDEKITRSLKLMDVADEVFAQEGNAIAVAERLLKEDDVAEMYYDERGVWYRVEGAPPMVFLHPETFSTGLQGGNSYHDPSSGKKVLLRPFLPDTDGPVGDNPPREKAQKKALFINPIAWELGSDVHDSVKPLLQEHRDYECAGCVKFLAESANAKDLVNDENPSAGPSVEQFIGWEDYDLIHVTTHGQQFCPGQSVSRSGQPVVSADREQIPENTLYVIEGSRVSEGECVTVAMTGHFATSEHLQENPKTTPGVIWFHAPGSDVWGELITTDFFKATYKQGLDDKVIFFTGCHIFRDQILAQTLSGANSAVLGWTDYVWSDRGHETAIKFFEELIENGLRASVAYQKTKQSKSHSEHSEDWFGAQLEMVPTQGETPRGREVITMLQPVFRNELEEGDALPTIGVAGDGENDELLLLVQIDGIDEDQNPDEFIIHVSVDGQELDETLKPEEKIGEYSYWGLGQLPLPFDASERDVVELEAWVELPEGGDSRHVLEEVELANCGWTGTLSGGRSGSIKGDIVYPSSNLSNLSEEQLSQLANQGQLGPLGAGGEMPTASDLANMPFSVMMGDQDQFPFLLITPGQSAASMLESMTLGFGTQAVLDLSEDSDERMEGNFSATLTEMTTQQQYSVQGKLIWHVDSICSMDVVLELGENPLPGGLSP
jgi:hypothetical protein